MKLLFPFLTCLAVFASNTVKAQNFLSLNELQPGVAYENIHVHPLDSDERASTFIIWVKREVKAHYHKDHTEVVYVLEGHGSMTLGEVSREIGPGDYVFIPKGTAHSVKVHGEQPMKVISIQTPAFDGADRHFITQ